MKTIKAPSTSVSASIDGASTTTAKAVYMPTLAVSGVTKMSITPEIAEAFLSFNTNNRKVKKERVALYAQDMKRGQWKFTGDSIRLATLPTGEYMVVDGQHRLMACISSGTPFEALVITGLDPSVFSVIDRGATRSNGDILGIAGFTNGTTVGAMVRPLIAYEAGLNPLVHGALALVTGEDIVRYCQDNREAIVWAKAIGEKAANSIGGIKSAWGMFALIASQARGRKLVSEFIDETSKGVGLYEGDPRLAIRSFLLKTGTSTGPTARNYREAGTLVRVFNAYLEGRKVSFVRPWGNNSSAMFPKVSMVQPFDWASQTPSDEIAE